MGLAVEEYVIVTVPSGCVCAAPLPPYVGLFIGAVDCVFAPAPYEPGNPGAAPLYPLVEIAPLGTGLECW